MIDKFVVVLLIVISLAVLGIVIMFGEDKSEACATRGGTLVKTYEGLVCAKLERV